MNDEFKQLYLRHNFVVLDTETTGLYRPAEIIDIAIYDADGHSLLDTLIRPKKEITPFITDLTGITNEMVQDSATWPDVKTWVLSYISGKDVVAYNAKFDRHMMHCSDEMWNLGESDYHAFADWFCAMEAYAPYHKQWDVYYGSFKWARLSTALAEQKIPKEESHRAAADVRMTLKLLDKMCKA